MKKYNIMGHEMVKVSELRHAIRRLRKDVDTLYANFDEDHRAMVQLAYNDIVRALYREELKAAKSPDEIEAILEMPGDFLVIKREGKRDLSYFAQWNGPGKAEITKRASGAMHFDYESMAEKIAERLGDGWRVFDNSPEDYEYHKRLLEAIFGEESAE